MKIEATEQLTHPAEQVFEAVRDKTPELADMMPNIDRVEILEERREGDLVHFLNRWHGARTEVPAVLRPFASKDFTAWHDRADWYTSSLSCSWQIDPIVAKGMFTCVGKTHIRPLAEGGCTFELRGELTVDPNKIPGVPRFLGRKLQGTLERFIVGNVSPNLTGIAKAVQRFLDEAE